ncbi:FAD dependent oxidoreductase [Polaribacter sp. KT25b]|uniref:FAD-dependent oxidoreductase n=1 Tax=Polaribacter sp. KT25b TaxID=1855336 RepID=UPI00087CE70F|nr:FAD-dependent oxidoreductase [Polaribacter sp. KT25b]SDR70182.1 FAD dependent oxidoreductase [Polaribacter sp. KT25b]
MKRRDFFKKGTQGVVAASIFPIIGDISAQTSNSTNVLFKEEKALRETLKKDPIRRKTLVVDVAVIGGGMSGISAAVSAARNGAKVVLVQDRPVLGGNASSEMRVTVNGVKNLENKHKVERETGIVEELLIENWHYNPQESYHVWDHVLYNYVIREKNLTLLLNTTALDVNIDENKIKSVVCRQLTTETDFTINAPVFVDCSGDGFVAATAGAEFKQGREGKAEFNEKYAPDKPDGWVMGDCFMMITKDMGRPVPFYAPEYAVPFDAEKAFKDKHRKIKHLKEGFWWVELGSDVDIIGERDEIRHKLMANFYGVWNHIKNSGDFPEAANIVLDWVGSIPGRRESRRFVGDYILSEPDMLGLRHFDDAIAFGGWSLDEHCPGGIENLNEPASYFHSRFKEVYQIPFRCLYSKNIDNLLFAGRNVSVTHIALSSTRIIGTCSMMGQAAGTAAAMCANKGVSPRKLYQNNINDLQEQLLRDDSYFPHRPAKDPKDKARTADLIFASSTSSGDVKNLLDGVSRDEINKIHHWQSEGLNAELQLEWNKPQKFTSVEMKFDTNLQRLMMMHKDPAKNKGQVTAVPPELIKDFTVEARVQGNWKEVGKKEYNITRLVKINFDEVKATAIRLKLKNTHGKENIRMFEVRCY